MLCKTLAGNVCDLLTITDFTSPPEDIRNRKGVVITARVHAGAAIGSRARITLAQASQMPAG